MKDGKVRYAVVGSGAITSEHFLPALAASGNSTLTCVFSGNPARAAGLAGRYGCAEVLPYDAFEQALTRDLFDAVYIAVPNTLHARFALPALRQGTHVLVEKPMASRVEDAQAMVEAARQSGALLMTSYRMHVDPVSRSVADQVRAGTVGEARLLTSTFSFQVERGNHRLQASYWGGALQDIGLYCINTARHLFADEPELCLAMATRPPNDSRFDEVDDAVSVTLRFPGMRMAQFVVSFGAAPVDEYHVIGTQGSIRVAGGLRMDSPTEVSQSGDICRHDSYDPRTQFVLLVSACSDNILRGTTPIGWNGEDGLRDLLVLQAAEQSLRQGQAVQL